MIEGEETEADNNNRYQEALAKMFLRIGVLIEIADNRKLQDTTTWANSCKNLKTAIYGWLQYYDHQKKFPDDF